MKQRAGELGIPLDDPVVEKLLEPVDSQTYQSVVPIHDSAVESIMDNTTISQDTTQVEKPNVATYWRDGLPDEGKAIYDTWYGYLKEGYQQIHLDVPYVGNEQLLSNTWEAVKYDHPELFWVDQGTDPNTGEATSDYTVHYYNDPSKGMDITHHFVCPIEEIPNLAAQIDDAIRQFRSFVGNETNPRQIAIKAAVWLSNRLEYDYSYGNLDQCLLSSLLSDKTVCTGYGAAYKTLLASYDIPCISVVGYAKPTNSSRHMWNAVWVDGKWSSVDVTWLDDDGIGYGWEYFMFAKDENESRNVIGPINIPATEAIEDIRASGRKQEKALDMEYQSSLNG